MHNKEKSLPFSNLLKATWLTNVKDFNIKERTIVANVGENAAVISTDPAKSIAPRTSTIFQGVTIKKADSLVLIHVPDLINLGGIIHDNGWGHLNSFNPTFPLSTPLYKSAQFNVGQVSFDPFYATGTTDAPDKEKMRQYQVKVNLWYSPEKTNCAIHNHHTTTEMLEVHTQIVGVGRMQKFQEKQFDTIYEDVILGAGMTHLSFAGVKEDGTFYYPWHQYYADTCCIWMAIEYHTMKSR